MMNTPYPDSPPPARPFAPVTPPTEPLLGPPIEDLTLGEALSLLVRRPIRTGRALWRVLTRDPELASGYRLGPRASVEEEVEPEEARDVWAEAIPARVAAPPAAGVESLRWARLLATGVAVLLAVQGGRRLHDAALIPANKLAEDTNGAFTWLGLAALLFLAVELWADRVWWGRRFPRLSARLGGDHAAAWGGAIVLVALAVILTALFGGFSTLLAGILAGVGLLLAALGLIAAAPPTVPPDVPFAQPAESLAADEEVYVVRSVVRAPPESAAVAEVGWQAWAQAHMLQLALIPVALALSMLAYLLNVRDDVTGRAMDVVLTLPGGLAWVLSAVAWAVALGGLPKGRARRDGTWRAGLGWPLLALLGALAAGAIFRLHDLASTPPEMTSDHIEKLLDALRVSDGTYAVFFPNNGGREAFQMYVVAFVADVLKLGFTFDALKWATIIEGLLTLPALWWMARQVIGTETPGRAALGNWVGAALAALVAVSSWHVMLSRLGLRIVLTPLATALVIGLLARAMRHGRIRDFLALGALLGASAYFYQADRMLPVLAAVGVGLAIVLPLRTARQMARALVQGVVLAAAALGPLAALWIVAGEFSTGLVLIALAWWALVAIVARAWPAERTLRYAGGLLAAAVVALAIYLPMYHYSQIRPDDFWNRTRGRMFGDNAFQRTDAVNGQLVTYEPSLREQAQRLWEQRAVLRANFADALRMFHWEGDAAWINNADLHPALGGVAGGLALLGLAVWVARTLRPGGLALWLLPLSVLIMLLPSALTLAYTIENPSFTRASGSLPGIFMLAALPLGLLAWRLARLPRLLGVPWGSVAGVGVIALAVWGSVGWEWENFFTDYRLNYATSWKPYHAIARPLREFAQDEGSYGNAFMVAYPHWLDHRILGAVAGDIRWPNGLVTRDELLPKIAQNQGTRYQYDPTKPLFLMFHPDDADTAALLQDLFPDGVMELYEYSFETRYGVQTDAFYTFVAPPGAVEGVADD